MYMYVYNMLLMQCETWCMYMGDKFVDKSIESYYTYECLMPHASCNHVTHINASCHTYGCTYHTYECLTSHMYTHHVTHMNASCHTYECVMSHL